MEFSNHVSCHSENSYSYDKGVAPPTHINSFSLVSYLNFTLKFTDSSFCVIFNKGNGKLKFIWKPTDVHKTNDWKFKFEFSHQTFPSRLLLYSYFRCSLLDFGVKVNMLQTFREISVLINHYDLLNLKYNNMNVLEHLHKFFFLSLLLVSLKTAEIKNLRKR